jgi:hypothetical protein
MVTPASKKTLYSAGLYPAQAAVAVSDDKF